jgi:hypothetical protein
VRNAKVDAEATIGNAENIPVRHPSEGWDPVLASIDKDRIKNWIPAFAEELHKSKAGQ